MMKTMMLLSWLCVLQIAAAGQIQNGIVRELNSGNKPIGGVAVIFNDAVPTTSDDNGRFRLVFSGKKAGDLIFKTEIKKNGYELVNSKELDVIKLSNTDLLDEDIILSAEGTIDAARKNYYGISDRALLANFTKVQKGLEAQLKATQINQIQYRDKFNLLQKQYDLQKLALDSLAEKFAHINFDDVSNLYKAAFDLFKLGQINEAIEKLEGANLINLSNEIMAEEQRIAKAKKQAIEGMRLQAELYVLSFQTDKAERFYDQATKLDSTNTAVIQDYAEFLRRQNKAGNAILYYQKLLCLVVSDEDRATICNQTGNLYRTLQNNADAEKEFLEALRIFRMLHLNKPDQFVAELGWTLNNMGNYYRSVNNWDKSQACFQEALDLFRKSNATGKNVWLPNIALTLNNLGNCYFNNSKSYKSLNEAKKAYNESLDIYQQLADNNPNAVIPKDIRTFFDLKVNISDNSKEQYELLKEYEIILLKALKIHRQLAAVRPDDFLPFAALTLNNLGNLYSANYQSDKAEKAYDEALIIYKGFAEKNYAAFSPFVAATEVSLAKLYISRNNLADAEKTYTEALAIYRAMEDKGLNISVTGSAPVYIYLGKIKTTQKKFDSAFYYFDGARQMMRNESTESGDVYNDWPELYTGVQRLRTVVPDAGLKAKIISLGPGMDSDVVTKIIPQARKSLLNHDIVKAEKILDQLEQLGIRPVEAKIIRAHCWLLKGMYNYAKPAYAQMKDLRDSYGNPAAAICIKDLKEMQQSGITDSNVQTMIDLLSQ